MVHGVVGLDELDASEAVLDRLAATVRGARTTAVLSNGRGAEPRSTTAVGDPTPAGPTTRDDGGR